MTASIHGVLLDLDDTWYPQAEFLTAAWRAVTERGAGFGLDQAALLTALCRAAAHGSGRGGIIALSGGQLAGPDGVTTQWQLRGSRRSDIRAEETDHAERLIHS